MTVKSKAQERLERLKKKFGDIAGIYFVIFNQIQHIRLSLIGFRLVDFFSEKIIAGSHWVPDPPSLAQMTFTQCTSMSELKIDSGAPPGGQI